MQAAPARIAVATALLCAVWGACTHAATAAADPYERLRAGYAAGDASVAAEAYAPDAIYTEEQPGGAVVTRVGRGAIASGFAELFESLGAAGPARSADLNFRMLPADASSPELEQGVYRLRIGRADAGTQQDFYGRFAVARRDGRFVSDASRPGTRDDFEGAAGPVRFAAEAEVLDPAYYDRFLGDWRDAQGCTVRVTRSMRRLYARDLCAGTWRALTRQSGRRWTAGDRVVSERATTLFAFEPETLVVTAASGGVARRLERAAAPHREPVRFRSGDVELAGVVLAPAGPALAQRPGVVVVHGSGPQDRHGYASIVDTIAQEFAALGAVVLAYDKRGVGGSQGDWSRSGFDLLAADVSAAMAALRARPDVDPARVGIAGSSQAGWIVARALERGTRPALVLLLGAAGTALSVREQNLYNTEVRMRCAGMGARDVELALRQQRAFFDARRDVAQAGRLARVTADAARRAELAEWLFPASVSTTPSGEWYDVLDPDFDPRPAWRAWQGPSLFLFGSLDDSTPASLAAARARADAEASDREVAVLDGAQHLGLRAAGKCAGELEQSSEFHPDLWRQVGEWFQRVSGPEGSARMQPDGERTRP